jgi:hypothetical protein
MDYGPKSWVVSLIIKYRRKTLVDQLFPCVEGPLSTESDRRSKTLTSLGGGPLHLDIGVVSSPNTFIYKI